MSHTPQKSAAKMCKSPKNTAFKHTDKIEYESLSTNCTVVGSNNLNLVKKPQIITNMSPVYSNPSPSYPQSPYSSPASLKSPSPNLKPPTPQPNFPVMQIIHNSHPLITRQIQSSQPQNIIKLKPHLNILPKPSASPQPSPKPSVSPQIVIPNHHQSATIVPTAQPLLLNQMPMLTAPAGVQFILRPQTAPASKLQGAAAQATATPQGLILQPGGAQQLLHIQQPTARTQPMVRVLTNGVQLGPGTTTYVTQMANQQAAPTAQIQQQVIPTVSTASAVATAKKKPKHKPKKKLDLANIMKLSGIGDDDDIQFESDASQQSETSEHNGASSVPGTPQPQVTQADVKPKLGGIQIQSAINAAPAPLVQVLNQNLHGGMLSNSTSQATAAQAGIPFNGFIAPNFTINNGLMLQRSSGGYKLTMGEDGRLVLQHDPQLQTQDLQSQLILQSLLGLNGGLVLQPSMDQQTVQQTVQTIQQQSVQTIQQQTVQSQTIQTVQQQTVPTQVQHALQSLQPQIQQQTVQQTIQHQTVSQPLTALQQPMQIVQPQPIHSIHSQVQPAVHSIQSQVHSLQSQIQGQLQSLLQQQNHVQNHSVQGQMQALQSPVHTLPSIPSSPVQQVQTSSHQPIQSFQQQTQTQPVLKVQPFQKSQPPVQTVHPQPIQQNIQHQQQQQQQQNDTSVNSGQPPPTSYVVNLTPDQLEQLKRNGQVTVNGQTIFMQRPNKNEQSDKKMSPKSKPIKKVSKIHAVKNFLNEDPPKPDLSQTKDIKPALLSPKPQHVPPQNHVMPQNSRPTVVSMPPVTPAQIAQPQVQPSAVIHPSVHLQREQQQQQQQPQLVKPKVEVKQAHTGVKTVVQQKVTPQNHQSDTNGTHQDVDKLLGQILEETGQSNQPDIKPIVQPKTPQPQQITTIQLTPQKQQHLRSIQLQIQTLSSRMQQGNVDMDNALKRLFNEQQKILASGKVLPPDKVYYHNNQLTIVNPGVNLPSPGQIKSEPHSPPVTTSAPGVVRPVEQPKAPVSVPPIVTTQTSEHSTQTANVPHPITNHLPPQQAPPRPIAPQPQQQPPSPQQTPQPSAHSQAKKAHLIEQQMNLDQNEAVKPDVNTPFRDKKDACIRLIRYHCLEQPVLSEKDLGKADKIFEMTARHYMGKYSKMVDKYKYLLLKESMRHVPTSELMMLDRMFLADEQQSIMQLRQDIENQLMEEPVQIPDPEPPPQPPDVYDEWACIQRELASLPQPGYDDKAGKRALAGQDSRLETLKKFRVDKKQKQEGGGGHNSSYSSSHDDNEPENNSIDEQVQSAIDSILNLQQATASASAPLDLDSILS